MNAPVELFLREAAIGAGDDVLPADERGEPQDAFSYKFRMLHDICAMADDAGGQDLAFRQLDILPDAPFVFMTWIGGLDEVRAGADLENEIDDFPQRNVGRVRSRPASPANVVAHTVFRDSFQGMVQDVDMAGDPSV